MLHRLDYDKTDLIFRVLFSLIFLGLGAEHLFRDDMIQMVMPAWMPLKPYVSKLAGLILLVGGLSVMFGYKCTQGAIMLGAFLIVVSLTVHLPALFYHPADLDREWFWLWDVYQRSNLVKNLCLLGVCFHLINHKPGRWCVDKE